MTNSEYKGSYKLSVVNNVLVAEGTGVSSKKLAEQYASEFKSCARNLSENDWCQIVLLHNWVIGTPEIEPVFRKLSRWNITHNLRATAFVCDENSLKRFQLESMYMETPDYYHRGFFDNQESAFKWLVSLGFVTGNLYETTS